MKHRSLILFTLAGMAAGYLLMHPFAMLAYILDPSHPRMPLEAALWHQMHRAFAPEMVAMTLAFTLMGGLAGMGLGGWHLQKLESQRRLAALETLRRLVVTLAHHIRNANLVIGGFGARLAKHLPEPDMKEQAVRICQASREIEAVIASLENVQEISYRRYASAWETTMIDLQQELQTRLKTGGTAHDGNESETA